MATELQKKLAENIVKNLKRKKPLNKGQLVEISGYSKSTATQQLPAVFEQKGVREHLEVLGFNENAAKLVVEEIMNNSDVDPNARLKATDQVFKVEGSYAPEKTSTLNLNIEGRLIANPELEALRIDYEEKLKAKLINNG